MVDVDHSQAVEVEDDEVEDVEVEDVGVDVLLAVVVLLLLHWPMYDSYFD